MGAAITPSSTAKDTSSADISHAEPSEASSEASLGKGFGSGLKGGSGGAQTGGGKPVSVNWMKVHYSILLYHAL